jgi:[ribulose-bisphosphate carboxylase]-lysine N-methyltransferase
VVPRRLWMTPQTAAASPLGAQLVGQPPWVVLALHLLAERADPSSRWAPYLALLPPVLDSPVFWTEEQGAELAGSQLGSSVASYQAFLASTWADLASGPLAASPGLFPEAVFNQASFAWAFGTLRSRCLSPADAGDAIALVPGLDLVNHSSAPGTPPAWTPLRSGGGGSWLGALAAGLSGAGASGDVATCDAMAHVPQRPYTPGEQLLGSYSAELLDSQLALDFGCADAAHSRPGYLLQLTLTDGDRFVDDKTDVCDAARVPSSPQFVLLPSAPPPGELRTFLRLVHLGGVDAFLLEPLFRDACWAMISEPVSLANETAVVDSLLGGCTTALAAYPTTARQDEDLLARGGTALDARAALALRVRLGEKRALQATAEAYAQIRAGLARLEYYQERRLRGLKLLDDDGKSTYDPFVSDTFKTW